MEELVKRAKNKDEKAFDELILAIKEEMYLIAKTRLYSDDDIADAMQETILQCFKNLHRLKNNKFFKTWVIRILINECNIIYRKKYRQTKIFNKLSISKTTVEIANPFNITEDKIDFDILLKHLNEKEQLILALHYNSKYTPDEISDILGINANTIKSTIYRTKQKLRKYLEKEELDNESRK